MSKAETPKTTTSKTVQGVFVDTKEKVWGKIWLLTPDDLDRLPPNTELVDIRGKHVNLTTDHIDDTDVRNGYIPYGLPCGTWSFESVWKTLKSKQQESKGIFATLFGTRKSKISKEDGGSVNEVLARFPVSSRTEADIEWCTPFRAQEFKEEKKD